jgi:hypothetical protein
MREVHRRGLAKRRRCARPFHKGTVEVGPQQRLPTTFCTSFPGFLKAGSSSCSYAGLHFFQRVCDRYQVEEQTRRRHGRGNRPHSHLEALSPWSCVRRLPLVEATSKNENASIKNEYTCVWHLIIFVRVQGSYNCCRISHRAARHVGAGGYSSNPL